jgi:hypothetical protein
VERTQNFSQQEQLTFLSLIRDSVSRGGSRGGSVAAGSPALPPAQPVLAGRDAGSNNEVVVARRNAARRKDLKELVDMQKQQYTGILVELTLIDCGIEFDLMDLRGALGPATTTLNLTNNMEMTGNLAILSDCHSLHYISLERTRATGDIAALTKCTHLNKLFVSGLRDLTGDISVFRQFKGLKKAWLRETSVYGDIEIAFQHCQRLVDCLLRHTLVHGDIRVFAKMKYLQMVSLSKTGVSGDIKAFIRLPCLALKVCALEFCDGITGDREEIERKLPRCIFSF